MRMTTLHVSRKFNLGNYESMDLGGEFSLEETDTLELATLAASNAINTMFNVLQHPESVQIPAPASEPEPDPATAPAPTASSASTPAVDPAAPMFAPEPEPVNPTTTVPEDKDPFAPAKEPEAAPATKAKKHVTYETKALLQNIMKRIEKNGQPITDADKADTKYAGLETYPVIDWEFLTARYTFDQRAENSVKMALELSKK